MPSNNNIVLIGFMGVGKGSLARALVRETGMYSVDTDDLIESLENRKIKDIFKKDGEEYFRALEKRTAEWLEVSVSDCIISTGGGFHAVDNLNRIGTVVYLESDFDAIISKITGHHNSEKKIKKRPLLKDLDKARVLFNTRAPVYKRKADITVNVTNRPTSAIVDELLAKLARSA
jgi:shikimate kinase